MKKIVYLLFLLIACGFLSCGTASEERIDILTEIKPGLTKADIVSLFEDNGYRIIYSGEPCAAEEQFSVIGNFYGNNWDVTFFFDDQILEEWSMGFIAKNARAKIPSVYKRINKKIQQNNQLKILSTSEDEDTDEYGRRYIETEYETEDKTICVTKFKGNLFVSIY